MRPDLVKAIQLLRSDDADSINEAMRLLQGTVYSFSMKVCGHAEDAEDTMQDVLVRSLPHLAKITDPKALTVWLYTVTRNRCWRSRRKPIHAPKQTLPLDDLMPNEMELEELLHEAQMDPERQLLAGEQNQLLHRAILSVPPELRLVLVLHDVEDLDTEQVAQVLGLLPGTVRVRLHRARLYVRKAMAELVVRVSATKSSAQPAKAKRSKASKNRPAQCKEIFSNLSEYLDDRLSPSQGEQMRRHIEACPACIAFITNLRHAIDRCRNLELGCEPDLLPRLRAVLTKE